MTALICWVIVMIKMAVIEVVVLNLNYIWFAVAALIAAVFALFQMPIWSQCLIFAIVSLVLILFVKPIMKRKVEEKRNALMIKTEELDGTVAVQEEDRLCKDVSDCESEGDKKE